MKQGLENLGVREYPGRVIITGKDKTRTNVVVVYAITGRSPSSQARKIVKEGETIWVKPTDEEILKEGKEELLIYPAICLDRGIVVGNGRQTSDIKENLSQSQDPSEILKTALLPWDYEPDPPLFTPRISGCVLDQERAALSLIKRAEDGTTIREIFPFSLIQGKGKMIATYEGHSAETPEPFSGEPVDVELNERDSKDMAEAVYEALGPLKEGKDYRVSVACVYSLDVVSGEYEFSIINKQERIEESHGKDR